MTDKNPDALLPCPFCGGDLPVASLHTDYHKRTSWRVNCFHCGALGSGASAPTKKEAERRWNTRATPHAEAVRVLVEALEIAAGYPALVAYGVEKIPITKVRAKSDCEIIGSALSHPAVVAAMSKAEGVK